MNAHGELGFTDRRASDTLKGFNIVNFDSGTAAHGQE